MKKDLGLTALVAATLIGTHACSSNEDWDQEWNEDVVADRDTAVCVDSDGTRVDDDLCGDPAYVNAGWYRPYYYGRGSVLPYYGDSIHDRRFMNAGSVTPASGVAYDRAPVSTRMTRSQAVSRGGLGGSGRSFGGGRS